MQFDRGYISAYFHHQCRSAWKPNSSDPYILITDKKISAATDIVPILEKLIQIGKRELVIDRRRRRRRSAGDPRAEQAARHVQRAGDQSPGLWRPPQGHAAGHRHPDGRPGHHRRNGPQAGDRDPGRPGPSARKVVRQGRHDHHRRQGQRQGHQGPHRGDQGPDRNDHLATTTRRSCRNAWPSCPAAWRSSASAQRPRPN